MTDQAEPLHRVCAWLGEYLIIEYLGAPAPAARFENAVRGSFTTLRITNEPALTPTMAAARPGSPRDGDL